MPRRPLALQEAAVVLDEMYVGLSLTGSEVSNSSSCFRFRSGRAVSICRRAAYGRPGRTYLKRCRSRASLT
jgi:hypothetical protein